MIKKQWLLSMLSAAAIVAATGMAGASGAAVLPPVAAPATALPSLHTADQDLEAAYQNAWFFIDREYVNHKHLPADWLQWQHKYDGKLHSDQDLTGALNALLAHIGDPSVKLLSNQQALAQNLREQGGHLGYGLESKFLPVYGPTAVMTVQKDVAACANGVCWQGVGQAYKDGLRTGDVIVAVDGKSIEGLGFGDLFNYVSSRDQVVFTIKRGSQILTITAHPQRSHDMNLNLDASIGPIGDYRQAYVFADAGGPAQAAGIAEQDELVSINGRPADQMTDGQLKALDHCRMGDRLRLKVRRLSQDVIVPCGPVAYDDHNSNGNAGGVGGQRQVWEYSVLNLDAPRVVDRMQRFLAFDQGNKDVAALIDLRGSYGTKTEAAERIATMFVQQGTLDCLYSEGRTDILCDEAVKGRIYTRWDNEYTSAPQPPFNGKVAVLIDDRTSGTALMLAAELQKGGAVIITTGKPVRHWPDLYTNDQLKGDPEARSIEFPLWHTALTDQKETEIKADIVAPKGQEFDAAQHYLGLPLKPYDLRADN